jgi:hypothetical protein
MKFLRSSTIDVMMGKPNFANIPKTTRNAINIQNNSPRSGLRIDGRFKESISQIIQLHQGEIYAPQKTGGVVELQK